MADPDDSVPPFAPEVASSYPTPRQKRLLWTALTALAVTTLAGVASLVFLGFITFLSWSYSVLLPIGLAVMIALVLEPVVDFVQRRGMKRSSATLTVTMLMVVGVLLFWAFLLQPLCSETGSFFSHLPGLIDEGVDKLQALGEQTSLARPEVSDAGDLASAGAPGRSFFGWGDWLYGNRPAAQASAGAAPQATNWVVTNAVTNPAPVLASTHGAVPRTRPLPTPRPIYRNSAFNDWIKANIPVVEQSIENNVARLAYSVLGPVGQAFEFMLGFGFVPIYVYYFLADRERIVGHWHEYVPLRDSPLRNEVVAVLTQINEVLVKYLRGQIVVATCNGVLTSIGLTLIGIPYSLVLGIMTGVLSIVPFLGIIVSIVPALLLGFSSTHGWLKPVLVLVVFALVQMSESMFISPRVQSHSTGLHPLAIIIGILFWSMLLPGLLGPVVAVPLTCAVVVLLRRYVWNARVAGSGKG